MSAKSFPFDSEPIGQNERGWTIGDRDMDSADWAEYFASLVGNGIFANPSLGLTVVANGGMSVTVEPGRCWINGYYFHSDEDTVLKIESAESEPRIDRIVAQWNLPAREIRLAVKKGVSASTPEPPVLQRDKSVYELGLAEITVSAESTAIRESDITDTRLDGTLCGMVAALVDRIDFSIFFKQYEMMFLNLYNYANNLLDGGDVTKILNEMYSMREAWESAAAALADIPPSGIFTELDDIEICEGRATAYNGTYIAFPREFSGVPRVLPGCEAQERIIRIYNVTAKGFYCTVTAMSVTTETIYTGSSSTSSVTDREKTVVTGVEWTAVSTTISYVAVYNGGV